LQGLTWPEREDGITVGKGEQVRIGNGVTGLGSAVRLLDPPIDQRERLKVGPPVGIFGVAFGIFNIGYGIPLSITGPGDAYFSGSIPIAFGASFIALGAVGIHVGKRRGAAWQAWKDDPTTPPQVREKIRRQVPPHVPWLIAGGVTTPVGLATVGLMIPILADPILNTPHFAYGLTAWGAASVAAGVAMLTVGGLKSRRRATHVVLVPTSWANRDGFGFGVAGRF
jgi:hypothetical protein